MLDGYSPYELVFGRAPPNLLNFDVNDVSNDCKSFTEYMAFLKRQQEVIHDTYTEWKTLHNQQCLQDSTLGKHLLTFQVGDLVGLLAPHASALQTNSRKFRQDFVGPMVVSAVLDDTHYMLCNIDNSDLTDIYHINRLKP